MGIVQVRDDSGRWRVMDEESESACIMSVLRCRGCGIPKSLFKDDDECEVCGDSGQVWVPLGCLLAAQEKAL